ncbi:MAG: hypothetical protein ACRDOK_03305 [Streptosporangiaceae bacterium]
MRQQDPRAAARDRDVGLRKIGRLTWRAGLAGAVCSAVMALAFGHHAADATSSGGSPGGSSSSTTHNRDGGSIVIPGQPPQPASGPSHVTSGGTSTHVP